MESKREQMSEAELEALNSFIKFWNGYMAQAKTPRDRKALMSVRKHVRSVYFRAHLSGSMYMADQRINESLQDIHESMSELAARMGYDYDEEFKKAITGKKKIDVDKYAEYDHLKVIRKMDEEDDVVVAVDTYGGKVQIDVESDGFGVSTIELSVDNANILGMLINNAAEYLETR